MEVFPPNSFRRKEKIYSNLNHVVIGLFAWKKMPKVLKIYKFVVYLIRSYSKGNKILL